MEVWLWLLAGVVTVMALVLGVLARRGGRAAAGTAGGPAARGAFSARRGPSGAARPRFHLAPKNPEVMAAMLFDCLSRRLNFSEMLSFADLIASPELTERFLQLLASRNSPAGLAEETAFLCRSMVANGYTAEQRMQVSAALNAKAHHERKLLEIQKNLDKLF
jgi:hypothetical protein